MGKKSAKGKAKKELRKAEQAQLADALNAVKQANTSADPLTDNFPVFKKFTKNGLNVSIACRKVPDMSKEESDMVFQLVKDNMQELYKKSNWGWDEKKKREEMLEDNSTYLIVHDENDHIVAMSHFRFDVDADMAVLYCYEVQLLEHIRGKGLGKFMMQILELLANKAMMSKVILTLFKENDAANRFFSNLKYAVDETSPQYDDPNNPQDYDYEIMSKLCKHAAAQVEAVIKKFSQVEEVNNDINKLQQVEE